MMIGIIWSLGFVLAGLLLLSNRLNRKEPEQKTISPHPTCTAGIHFLTVINVQPGPSVPSLDCKTTFVLKRCALCGAHVVNHFQGEWSISDMTAKESEFARLEGMLK